MSEIAVIGDVHGCYTTLRALIQKIPQNVKICFVGDLVDRGKDSRKVVEFVKENNYDCILGNHETFCMGYDRPTWLNNGGEETLKSYEGYEKQFEDHISWMKTLPIFLEYKDVQLENGRSLIVTHSGVFNSLQSSIEIGDILWGRHFPPTDFDHRYNIFGHTPHHDVRMGEHWACIDTGCVFKRKLTALLFPSLKIIEQQNIE